VLVPPRPAGLEVGEHDAVDPEALIEEARRRARKRRFGVAAIVLAAGAGVAVYLAAGGGGSGRGPATARPGPRPTPVQEARQIERAARRTPIVEVADGS
jgi:hypothetical protein